MKRNEAIIMGFYCFILKRKKKAKVFLCHRVAEPVALEVGLRAGRRFSLDLDHDTVKAMTAGQRLMSSGQ